MTATRAELIAPAVTIDDIRAGNPPTNPAKPNVTRFLTQLRADISAHTHTSALDLMAFLNPKLKGWAHFYRYGVSQRTFEYLDHHMFWALWHWAKRRHPTKSKSWRIRHYFTHPRHKLHFCGQRQLELTVLPQLKILL